MHTKTPLFLICHTENVIYLIVHQNVEQIAEAFVRHAGEQNLRYSWQLTAPPFFANWEESECELMKLPTRTVVYFLKYFANFSIWVFFSIKMWSEVSRK